jgi:23S rRNA pseudouridine2605 synthase
LPEGNPAAFRTWYVPDGVDTGPTGHRNAENRGPRKPYGKKPRGAAQGKGGQGQGHGQGPSRHPYGHPGNAPVFPSDHANPGARAGEDRRGPRPGKPGGGRRPGGPKGPRPGGPRGGGRPGGGRGPRG